MGESTSSHPAWELLHRLRDGERFSSVTALALLGAPVPWPLSAEVHVSDDPVPIAWIGGAPISMPEHAFLEASESLPREARIAVEAWLIAEKLLAGMRTAPIR